MLTALLPNPSAAILIGVALMIPLTAFAGFFLNYKLIAFYVLSKIYIILLYSFASYRSVAEYFVWIRYLSWLSYGTESLFINQWNGIDYIECKNNTISSLCLNNNGADVLNYYAMDKVGSYLPFVIVEKSLVPFQLLPRTTLVSIWVFWLPTTLS
jgi:hypothetical protein